MKNAFIRVVKILRHKEKHKLEYIKTGQYMLPIAL